MFLRRDSSMILQVGIKDPNVLLGIEDPNVPLPVKCCGLCMIV